MYGCIDAMLTNRYNNYMGFARKTSRLVLTSMVIAGMILSSCGGNGSSGSGGESIGDMLQDAWDWLTGQPSRSERERLKKATHVAKDLTNPSKALANVNIKALPKDVRNCFKAASEYSGVPLLIMYTFVYGESDFNAKAVNYNHSPVKWDCGMPQDNVKEIVCPLAYRFAYGFPSWRKILISEHPKLFKAIQELGLKYVGGGYDYNCPHITHNEAIEYCSEVGTAYTTSATPSNPVCLGIMVGAYEMAKDYWLFHHDKAYHNKAIEHAEKSGISQEALANAGKYADWVYVAYIYNGLKQCYGVKCYFYQFSKHLSEIENGIINIAKKI